MYPTADQIEAVKLTIGERIFITALTGIILFTIYVAIVRWIFKINKIEKHLDEINEKLSVVIQNQPRNNKLDF